MRSRSSWWGVTSNDARPSTSTVACTRTWGSTFPRSVSARGTHRAALRGSLLSTVTSSIGSSRWERELRRAARGAGGDGSCRMRCGRRGREDREGGRTRSAGDYGDGRQRRCPPHARARRSCRRSRACRGGRTLARLDGHRRVVSGGDDRRVGRREAQPLAGAGVQNPPRRESSEIVAFDGGEVVGDGEVDELFGECDLSGIGSPIERGRPRRSSARSTARYGEDRSSLLRSRPPVRF